MPDTHAAVLSGALADAGAPQREARWPTHYASPLLRRILLVNLVPLALLLAALLYLDQYQNGLLEAEVGTLREQARIYAGALGEAAVRIDSHAAPQLVPSLARSLLLRLTEPSPTAQAKLYAPGGAVVADSRVRPDGGGALREQPLPPAPDRGAVASLIDRIYDRVLSWIPHGGVSPVQVETGPSAAGPDWQPDVREELRLADADQSKDSPPYIRRTSDNRLLITVAEPVQQDDHTVGIISLTREAREVDRSLMQVRLSILGLFSFALALTVLMSWYLSLTIARPMLRLARAAEQLQEGRGRASVPEALLARSDEVGEAAQALARSARGLWERMDAIERFAADVAHEIKNPLSSIRSAIETLRRVEEPDKQRKLLGIMADDVVRLDRLITDISDASRIDAELSRMAAEPVDATAILETLKEIHDATRPEGRPALRLVLPEDKLVVRAVEGRLVQVLRNLIANAASFSPPGRPIMISARENGAMVEIAVEDDGPGIPEGKLEHVFDRFYSERPEGERFGQHSGLGLSISRQIAQALKGSLVAGNRRDAGGRTIGARFILSLPAAT
jgi:two-component system sensor histidine kinase ChvG